jgi:hypothetical protein
MDGWARVLNGAASGETRCTELEPSLNMHSIGEGGPARLVEFMGPFLCGLSVHTFSIGEGGLARLVEFMGPFL